MQFTLSVHSGDEKFKIELFAAPNQCHFHTSNLHTLLHYFLPLSHVCGVRTKEVNEEGNNRNVVVLCFLTASGCII